MRTVAFEIAVVPSVCCEVLQAVTHRADRAGCCSATAAMIAAPKNGFMFFSIASALYALSLGYDCPLS
jgi:hypothetical protein